MPIACFQTRYRFRTDTLTVDTASPTWGAAENTTYLPTPIQLGTPFRLRFEVQNTGTTTTGSATWEIYYSRNAGAYTPVTASSTHVQSSTVANAVDADDTSLATRRLTVDAGTYTNGRYDRTGQVASGLVTMAASSVTEFEFGLVLTNACRTGDTIDLQMRRNGATTTFTFTVTPRITVSQASLAGGLATGASSLAQPVLNKPLATAGIASGAAVMGNPTIAKTILAAARLSYAFYFGDQITSTVAFATGAASLGAPALTINGGGLTLSAAALATAASSLGQSKLILSLTASRLSYALYITDQVSTIVAFATGAASLGSPTLTINGAGLTLTGSPIATAASSMALPAIIQRQVLVGGLATVASVMGQPTLTIGGGIASVPIATRSAGLGLGNNLVPAFP